MPIKIVEDIGAPVLVAVADIATKAMAPTWSKWTSPVLSIIGYGGAFMNMGGDFVKNIGIASLPKTLGVIYDMMAAPAVSRVARSYSAVSRVAQTQVPEFQGTSLV